MLQVVLMILFQLTPIWIILGAAGGGWVADRVRGV